MEKFKVSFEANNQQLKAIGTKHASDTYADIEAEFVLGNRWTDMDSVSAVWWNDFTRVATVLDSQGKCIVPHEVLARKGCVRVNLVGSIVEGDELITRLTSYSAEAVQVNEKIKLTGSETSEITPSQFEQFVAVVISEVEKVTGMTAQAETLPAGSQATARYENGILYLGIPQGIQGERGETGQDGADGNGIASVVYNADYTLTLVFDNGETFTTPPIRGERGERGEAGQDGADGRDGADGVTPNLSVGNVTTLEPSQDAYVTRRGTDDNPIFDFGIPKGDKGDTGDVSQEQLDAAVSDLKSALNVVTDERTIPVERAFNAYFEVGAKVIVSASYTRMVYAPIDGNTAEKVTVSKTLGKLFRVGFTAVKPDTGVSIIDEAGTYIDAGQVTSTTVNVPSTAKYVVATIWNANTDASTTSAEDMIASVVITANYGAKDKTARQQIADTNEMISNLPAEDINAFTKTGWNYLDDALVKETGKYWNGATIGSPISLASNPSYNAVMIEADASIYKVSPYVRYIHALDADKNLLQVLTTDGQTTFDNTSLGAEYLCFTFHSDGFNSAKIYKDGTPPFEQYTARGQWVFPDLIADAISEDTIYLPSKVYCAVGRTIELYNEQVALNADKYHVNWVCDVGVAYKRKFSVTGANANIGTHSLTLNLYDDNYNLVASKTASLIISANSIASTIKVLPIGDSLTNGKEWLSEVPTLANSKIEYIGTRRLEGKDSEGRSGAMTSWYLANSSYTYADGSTYVGNPNVVGSSNPFWDGSKFSLNHYITQQASYVGTPDAVQIMLGTNDLKQTANVVANIKTMVDTIHSEYPTMPIFICNAIFHSNQNGYYSTGGEGYIGVMTNWQYELDRYTIALMAALAEVFDNDTYNSFVTLVPVASCMDRENDFGQVPVPVNPRLSTVTVDIPSQYTHPQSAGYLQMADAMYSAYCAKL